MAVTASSDSLMHSAILICARLSANVDFSNANHTYPSKVLYLLGKRYDPFICYLSAAGQVDPLQLGAGGSNRSENAIIGRRHARQIDGYQILHLSENLAERP